LQFNSAPRQNEPGTQIKKTPDYFL